MRAATSQRLSGGIDAVSAEAPVIFEFYLFRQLHALRGKDPWTFPERVFSYFERRQSGCVLRILDGYGPRRALDCLKAAWAERRRPQVAVYFHLTIRTLLFGALCRVLVRNQAVIVKADLTAEAAPCWKQRTVWRLVDRLADLIVCETPEAMNMLGMAGLARAAFVPNWLDHLQADPVGAGCDVLLVTRAGDSRKSPELTAATARVLAARGLSVACVGLAAGTSRRGGVRWIGSLPRHELLGLLASTRLLAGLSRSESYWFLVAEAAALGVPTCATPTGIAPYLMQRYKGLRLLRPAGDYTADTLAEELIAHLRSLTGSPEPFNINAEAEHRLAEALEKVAPRG